MADRDILRDLRAQPTSREEDFKTTRWTQKYRLPNGIKGFIHHRRVDSVTDDGLLRIWFGTTNAEILEMIRVGDLPIDEQPAKWLEFHGAIAGRDYRPGESKPIKTAEEIREIRLRVLRLRGVPESELPPRPSRTN